MDSSGNLYGTTTSGGTYGYGTVFELSPSGSSWTESVIWNFGASIGGVGDGKTPYANLTIDLGGNLYGTTSAGGYLGYGRVFELSYSAALSQWTEIVLWDFAGGNEGKTPWGGVILDSTGNLYGTTAYGGTSGYGIVYQLIPGSTSVLTVLHSFTGPGTPTDGVYPNSSLFMDLSGNLFGTTLNGGVHSYGTAYELSPTGTGSYTESVIYSFGSLGDGRVPYSGLVMDSSGNLYGTASAGGSSGNGTVYKLSLSGSSWGETTIWSFAGTTDGGTPYGGIVLDSSGNLYGTTAYGGTSGSSLGTVFELSPGLSWSKTILHNFGSSGDANNPYSGVLMDSSGNLYGTTYAGGASNHGAVYKIVP